MQDEELVRLARSSAKTIRKVVLSLQAASIGQMPNPPCSSAVVSVCCLLPCLRLVVLPGRLAAFSNLTVFRVGVGFLED